MDEAQNTDAELMLAVAGGDREPLALLYDRLGPAVASAAARFGLAEEALEDILHDVFLEVWAHAYEYDPERGEVLTWLVVRLRSRCLDLLRQRARRTRLVGANEDRLRPREPTPPGPAAVMRSRLRSAVAALDDDLRQVVVMAYFEGATTLDIAESLGIPRGTVKSRLRRAKAALGAQLGEGGPR